MTATLEPFVINTASEAYWQDPHGAHRLALAAGRTARTPSDELVILRHADVSAALGDPGLDAPVMEMILQRNGVESGPVYDWASLMMLNLVGDQHSRVRGLLARSFTAKRVESLRLKIRAQVKDLLREATDGSETIDWVADVSSVVPLWTMCEFIGLPQEDRALLESLREDHGAAFTDVLTPDQLKRAEESVTSMYDYVASLLERRRRAPQDDLLSSLVEAEDEHGHLTEAELVATVANLLLGGNDTTGAQIASSMALLVEHPDQLARVAADPTLIPRVIEESLRLEPPAPITMRRTSVATELCGLSVPADSTVHLAIIAANRDPAAYDQPDRFDLDRQNAPAIRTFGYGAHFCIGSALAKMEIGEVLSEALGSYTGFGLVDTEVEWSRFDRVRTPASLRIALQPAV